MITLSKISLGNVEEVTGTVGEEDFKISFVPKSYDKLQDLAKKLEESETFEDFNTYIKEGLDVIHKTPYYYFNSNYLCRIHKDYYIYFNDMYYKIPDPKGKFKALMLHLEGEVMSIDKIVTFIARGGKVSYISPSIYKLLNKAGNFLYTSINCFATKIHYQHDKVENIISAYEGSTRVFTNTNELLKQNTNYSLKVLGITYKDCLSDIKSITKMGQLTIHPNKTFSLSVFISKIVTDPEVTQDWSKTIENFILKHGTKKHLLL